MHDKALVVLIVATTFIAGALFGMLVDRVWLEQRTVITHRGDSDGSTMVQSAGRRDVTTGQPRAFDVAEDGGARRMVLEVRPATPDAELPGLCPGYLMHRGTLHDLRDLLLFADSGDLEWFDPNVDFSAPQQWIVSPQDRDPVQRRQIMQRKPAGTPEP